MVSASLLLVPYSTETTSSLVQLFLPLTLSAYTSTQSGKLHLRRVALQRWSLPARNLPLPHRRILLHGT
jgi:hypothetical protein